jgi:putative spermidine/putrescine transport system substrate-binding protein
MRGGTPRTQRGLRLALLFPCLGLICLVPLAGTWGAPWRGEVVLLTWGGAWHDVFRSIVPGFERETGVKVRIVTQTGAVGGLSLLRAQRHRPQVDVWTSIESTALAGWNEGLLDAVTADGVPNVGKVPSRYRAIYGPALWLSLRGIFYRADLVPFEIRRWEDLWDPRLRGRVAVTIVLDSGSFLVMAALINGGDERNIEPGFQKIRELVPNIGAVFRTDAESIRLLEAGEVAVVGWGILPNVYKLLLDPGTRYRFVVPPRPQFVAVIPISLVRGRPNGRNGELLMNYFLRDDIQWLLAKELGVVPANSRAKMPEKLRQFVPRLDQVYQVDWSVVNANFASWLERWAKEVGR